MVASLDDVMTLLQSMSSRLDTIQSTVTSHTAQITGVATAATAMQDAQAQTEAWQTKMADKMVAKERLIAELQEKAKKESPRHKQPGNGDQDAQMTDAATTPVPSMPAAPQHLLPRTPLASGRPPCQRQQRRQQPRIVYASPLPEGRPRSCALPISRAHHSHTSPGLDPREHYAGRRAPGAPADPHPRLPRLCHIRIPLG